MGDRQHNAYQLQAEIHRIQDAFRDRNDHGRLANRPAKKFISYDSLRFEKERLGTFIDWPVAWMKPEDLAKDGFFYLRTKDHCGCIFCRGIVGAWEQGDTPRKEHERLFPQCRFIQGHPVGNIPLAYSNIILGITPSQSASCLERRPPKPKKSDSTYSRLGLPPHTGPKRMDLFSLESRLKSFTGWPDGVKQTPKELAEAGFFYCGLSDHVRCFYCANGLRNWEKGDDPWEEHGRWYPECNFVLVKKGQEFIDRVRREKPPYLRSQPPLSKAGPLSEGELSLLMELDIIKATLEMGFPANQVQQTLRRELELTGLPFSNLNACIEAVLLYMEEEQRLQSSHESRLSSSSTSLTPTTNTNTGDETSSSLSFLVGSSQHSPTSSSSTEELVETESSPVTPTQEVIDLADEVTGPAEHAFEAVPTSSSSPTPNSSTESSLVISMEVPSSGDSATGKPQDLAVEKLDLKDTRTCKVCMDAELDMVFLPCTHMVTCSSCVLALNQCPICREDIKYAIKPILS